MIPKTTIYIGYNGTDVLEIPPSSSLFRGFKRPAPWRFFVDEDRGTVAFQGPFSKNPAAVFVAKYTDRLRRDLREDGYTRGGTLDKRATIIRRLGGL